MSLRNVLFWLHLVAGLIAGIVIAVMSFTGAMLAFEKQIVAWSERGARTVLLPDSVVPLSLDDLVIQVREDRPGLHPSAITVQNNPEAAVQVIFGRTNSVYINPYTAQIQPQTGDATRRFMQLMISWHRFLGQGEERRTIGKAITGACNAAFLVLAVTGVFLWWPRKWNGAALRAVTVFSLKLNGKARDWNWHNVVGFWTAPVLIVLTATALPISYRWAGDLIYRVTGTPPQAVGPGAVPSAAIEVPTPAEGMKPLKLQDLFAAARGEVPDWKEITFRLSSPGGRDGTGERRRGNRGTTSPGSQPGLSITNSPGAVAEPAADGGREPGSRAYRSLQSVTVSVKQQNPWPLFSSVQLTLDPFTGTALRKETFSDLSPGRQVRSWTRFLHTGEALGVVGQLIAGLASLVSLVLVWTGFALSWRRFFKGKRAASA